MGGYLDAAMKVRKASPGPTGDLVDQRKRMLEGAWGRGLIIRWSEYPTWIKLHDPTTGEWHEVKASECLPGVLKAADTYRKKGGAP
jgi:hypothetical protein